MLLWTYFCLNNALWFFWVYTLRVELLNNMLIKFFKKRFGSKISVLGSRLQHCIVYFLLERIARALLSDWQCCPVGDAHFSPSWHWTWPCDLLWPMGRERTKCLPHLRRHFRRYCLGFCYFPSVRWMAYTWKAVLQPRAKMKKTSGEESKPRQHETSNK